MSSATITFEPPRLTARWLGEPLLGFADGVEHPDPKVGIPYSGPRSYGTARHRNPVNVGFVGTGQSVDIVRRYLESTADGVDGDDKHHPFPGFRPDRGFRTELRTDDSLVATITAGERRSIMEKGKWQRVRFEELLNVLDDRVRHLADADAPVDLVVVILPDDMAKRCGTADYRENGRLVHRDLHAAFKARCMRYRMPTQIVWESTTRLSNDHSRDLEHEADVAWNLFTAIYFKADGFPWSPVGLPGGTCFVGIDFYRPQGDATTVQASLAQAFAETGDAFVLRGSEFRWDWKDRSPHLPANQAAELITAVRDHYERHFRRQPRHVVVHKRTYFDAAEREGFQDAMSGVEYDLVAVRPANNMRLLRNGEYPPQRGTLYTCGDRSYLYTTGTLAATGLYPHGHVPSPLHISDHIGDSPYDQLLHHILLLTKMNWNSARYAERMPVTLEFADRVSQVLKEAGPNPEPKYAFYM